MEPVRRLVREDFHWRKMVVERWACAVERGIGIPLCGEIVAAEASESAVSLWGRPQWLGTHWKIKEGMSRNSERSRQTSWKEEQRDAPGPDRKRVKQDRESLQRWTQEGWQEWVWRRSQERASLIAINSAWKEEAGEPLGTERGVLVPQRWQMGRQPLPPP